MKPLPQSDIWHALKHSPMSGFGGKRVLINGVGWFGGWVKDCLDAYGIRIFTRGRKDPFPTVHFEGFDFAIHAASSGVKEFCDYCEDFGIKRSLYISSGAIYHGDDKYAYDKRRDEKLCSDHPANPVIARCYTFIGPRQKLDAQWAVGNFLADAMAKRDILVKGDGLALRSYMHMADLTAWLLTLLVNGEPGKAYNVGSDESISIKGLAYMVARYSGSKVRVEGQMSGQSSYLPASFTGHHGLDLQTNIRLNEALERTWEWLNHS